ncbi:hypothetical protein [Zavarzinia sp. CC-PAN008]|uniref:hypothetical protein n=1 Tax=Zavarzinia sp. CC-PAN008 TaxID=3243332 RepID=UPI003F7469D4
MSLLLLAPWTQARPATAQAITTTAPSLGQGAPMALPPPPPAGASGTALPAPQATGTTRLGAGTGGAIGSPREPYAPTLGTGSGLVGRGPALAPLPSPPR